MSKRMLLAALISLCVCGSVANAHAVALSTASISMSPVYAHINAGQAPQFRYSTFSLPTGSVVQLQREFGQVWQTVKTVPRGRDALVKAPALTQLGKYTYRMQAVKNGAVVARTAHNKDIYVYAGVSIQSLCPHTAGNRVCAGSTTTVGGSSVTTHMSIGSNIFPNYFAGASYSRTSCRSAQLTFTNKHNATSKTWLKIFQSGHPDQVASAARNVLGHLSATLYGGAMFFDGSTESGPYSVYLDGTMSCWTTSGTY